MSVGLGFEKGEMRRRFLEPEPIQLFRPFKYKECFEERRSQWMLLLLP